MARVPLVQDGDEAARVSGIFDTFKDEGRDPSDIFRALANVPGLMMAHRALPQALRGRESCPPALRELGVLRLAQLVGSAYEWSHHRPMALAAGVTIQALGIEVEADHQHHLIDWVGAPGAAGGKQ